MSHVLSRPGRTVPSFRRTQCTCNGLTYPKPRLNHGKAFLLIISPQPVIMLKQKAVQMEADYLQCSGEGGMSRLLIHQWWSWAVMGSGQGVKMCANLQIWLIWSNHITYDSISMVTVHCKHVVSMKSVPSSTQCDDSGNAGFAVNGHQTCLITIFNCWVWMTKDTNTMKLPKSFKLTLMMASLTYCLWKL